MFTHQDIWNAIDRLAELHGYSTSGLAKKAGLDPTTFNKSKRFTPEGKPRWPSTESLSKILSATGANISDLSVIADGNKDTEQNLLEISLSSLKAGDAFENEALWKSTKYKNLPRLLTNESGFIVSVDSKDAEPYFKKNTVLLCKNVSELKKPMRVLIHSKQDSVFIAEIHSSSKAELGGILLNSDMKEFSLKQKDILWAVQIAWASQ